MPSESTLSLHYIHIRHACKLLGIEIWDRGKDWVATRECRWVGSGVRLAFCGAPRGAIRGNGVFRAGREHRCGGTDSFSYRQSGQLGQALDDSDNSDNSTLQLHR